MLETGPRLPAPPFFARVFGILRLLEIGSRLPKIADLRFLQARDCSPCLLLIILKAKRLGVGVAGKPVSGQVAVEGSSLKLINVVVRVLSQTEKPYEARGVLIRFFGFI